MLTEVALYSQSKISTTLKQAGQIFYDFVFADRHFSNHSRLLGTNDFINGERVFR
jgi:hypothetical protein